MPITKYCRKDINQHGQIVYSDFFESAMQVRMCGTPPDKIVKVQISEGNTENVNQWGYKDLRRNDIFFIYPSAQMVRMCSADGFQQAIATGTGAIIPVIVQEL